MTETAQRAAYQNFVTVVTETVNRFTAYSIDRNLFRRELQRFLHANDVTTGIATDQLVAMSEQGSIEAAAILFVINPTRGAVAMCAATRRSPDLRAELVNRALMSMVEDARQEQARGQHGKKQK